MKPRACFIALSTILVVGGAGLAKEKPAKEKSAKKATAQGRGLLAAGAEVKKQAGDFQFTEGPAGDAVGNVYFSDIPNNRILKWSRDGKLSTFLENSGGANGLYFDKGGNLLACQGGERRLVSISPKGEVTVLADKYDGKKFNSPNDLWIDPKGGVYFSDPRYGSKEGMEQDGEHVYYLTPGRQKVIRVISDMVRPNGVIGTPDGKMLYVADHGAGQTYAYQINDDGTLANRQPFAPQGSDGMTIDNRGNLYLTSKVITVYNPKGRLIQELQVPEAPANATFAGATDRTLFITARTSLYAVDMLVRGAPTLIRPDGQQAQRAKAGKGAKKAKAGKQ
jgi:gluconolactonase